MNTHRHPPALPHNPTPPGVPHLAPRRVEIHEARLWPKAAITIEPGGRDLPGCELTVRVLNAGTMELIEIPHTRQAVQAFAARLTAALSQPTRRVEPPTTEGSDLA